MHTLQTAFVIAICILLPLAEAPLWRQLRANSTSSARLALYRKMVLLLWLMAGVAAWLDVPAQAPGLEWLRGSTSASRSLIAVVVLLFGLQLWQVLRSIRNPRLRQRLVAAAQSLQFMLPKGAVERRWWVVLAISAGVCEEFVFRGFLMHYFAGLQLTLPAAWLLSCIAFGFGHAYQGRAAVLRSAIIGGILGLVVIASGGLALAMVLHAAADLLPLAYSESVAEVGDQVVGVFDADRHADQGVGDAH